MDIPATFFRKIISEAVEMGGTIALTKAGLLKPFIKKSEAYRIYGRTNIDRWLKAGLLKPHKDGANSSSWRLERSEIEILAKSNNWSSYIPVEDR